MTIEGKRYEDNALRELANVDHAVNQDRIDRSWPERLAEAQLAATVAQTYAALAVAEAVDDFRRQTP